MRIIIGADLVPTQSNIDLFRNGDVTELVGDELLALLHSADYRIFNLEVPLTDKLSPIVKGGAALIAPTCAIAGIKALKTDLFTVANNHIMDQDVQGLDSTLRALEENSISYVGAGSNLSAAMKPYITEVQGKKIGIYACAEHEFSIAGENMPGANPFDPLDSLDHVAELRGKCDYVIVLYHGGKEHYRYPSPHLQKVCRKLVQKGADLVICQHTHCVGCEEQYENGTIVYGQGNFLFDCSESEFWQTSVLVQIGDDFVVSYIPLQKKGNTVRLAQGEEAQKILQGFTVRSEEIKDPANVQKRYEKFAEELLFDYMLTFGGKESFFFRAVNKLCGNRLRQMRLKRRYGLRQWLAMRNFIECEAHAEVLKQGIQNQIQKNHRRLAAGCYQKQ